MPGFDAIYKQTVTLFNRVQMFEHGNEDQCVWFPTVLKGVHLIVDQSSRWDTQGGATSDNVRLHVRYVIQDGQIMVGDKPYYPPKVWRQLAMPETCLTFNYGSQTDFDFFVEGEYDEFNLPVADEQYDKGFYNYMNKKCDNVFAITSVSKYNLIPHFEIMAR